MEALAGPFAVAAVLLALGGGFKIKTPAPTTGALGGVGITVPPILVRSLGVGEVTMGAAALATGARPLAALVAAAYLTFAGFVVLAMRSGGAVRSCGCFGETETPPSAAHVVLNAGFAAAALGAAATGTPSLAATLADQPWAGTPFVLLVAVGVHLSYLMMTALPQALAAVKPALLR